MYHAGNHLSHRHRTRHLAALVTSLFILLGPVEGARGQGFVQAQKVTANDAVAGIGFGDSGALDGETAVVGATANGLANLSAGAAYVLEWNETAATWEHVQKLTADDGELDDRFGWSLGLDGDVIIVGAPDDDDGGDQAGAAYVFRRDSDTWVQEQKLVASDGAAGDRFGRSVAVYEDIAVVGAPSAEGAGGPTGAAYVFHFDGESWTQQQKIQVGSFATIAGLGTAVAASGDRILIGVPRAGPGAQNLGAAYVFLWDEDSSTWIEEDVLSASDQDAQDEFGSSVDLDGDVALIGVPQDEDGGAFSGAAYVFRRNGDTWMEEQKLVAGDPGEDDRFGSTVSLRGNRAAVGSPSDDHDGGSSAGSVYIFSFEEGSWMESQKLTAEDAGIGDRFGESLALDSDRLLVGASNNDDGGESAGSAYVFSEEGTGTAVEDAPLPSSILLMTNYPNPFQGRTQITYEVPEAGRVRLAVFDILGREIAQLVNELQPASEHTYEFDASDLPSGLYVARLDMAGRVQTILMMLSAQP